MTTQNDFDNFDDDNVVSDDDVSADFDQGAEKPAKKGSKLILVLAGVFVVGIGGFVAASNLGLLGASQNAPQALKPNAPTASAPELNSTAPAELALDAPSDNGIAAPSPAIDLAMPPAIGLPDAVPSIDGASNENKNTVVAPMNPTLHSGDEATVSEAAVPAMPQSIDPATGLGLEAAEAQNAAPQPQGIIAPIMPASDVAIASQIQVAPVTPAAVSAPVLAVEQPAPVAVDTVSVAPSESSAALQTQIASLEQTLVEMKEMLATKQDINEINSRLNALESAGVTGVKSSVTADEPSAVPVKKRTVKKKVASKKPVEAIKESHQWVLKAAKPGMAWIAQPGSSEIRAIAKGDTVPGLGTIKAIVKDSGGKWTVEGTKSRVNQ